MRVHFFSHLVFSSLMVFILFLSGCDRSRDETAVAAPPPEQLATEVPPVEKAPVLSAGQMEDEVRALLGKPSGVMSVGTRTTLIYNGDMITFQEGKLVEPSQEILDRMNALAAKNWSAAKKAEASVSTQKSSEPDAEKKPKPIVKKTKEESWLKEKISALKKARQDLADRIKIKVR